MENFVRFLGCQRLLRRTNTIIRFPVTNLNVIDPKLWVSKHADHLYSYAITRISDMDLAKDLVQETFLAALERVDQFEGRSSERTWLMAILKNKVIDVYRKKSNGIIALPNDLNGNRESVDFFEEDNGHWKEEFQPKSFGIEQYDRLTNKEFKQVLEQCLKKLPALWLSVFTMRHIDELSTQAICGQLKVSTQNFWVIIHRAKVNLRACLQKNW
jgi:RNA polymerase sigma-70 factor (TIGR02943 family)